ncbi:MAG: hypothetical protein JO043_12500 [Candidatus Eremiobacteraeota bacterium]|nr:hypothetical protein [Candidatus Eremiobacteraeota bacterium]
MTEVGLRPYVPVAIAAIIVVALILLGYLIGYRTGKAAGLHAPRTSNAVRK